ncbi:unnamed protein product [Meloidogyne enterolobii]|uniref:Uncharacterized protein n=1 Tax=Meloidogyne enterolobii TaxID=390850 RepID=A0ACB0XMJ1_MELEN
MYSPKNIYLPGRVVSRLCTVIFLTIAFPLLIIYPLFKNRLALNIYLVHYKVVPIKLEP